MKGTSTNHQLCGVILAGGQGSRMNNLDKPLQTVANRCLIEYVLKTAKPQVSQLAISVNRNLAAYEKYKVPLITDVETTISGPLVGIYSAMKWYFDQSLALDYLACFPADVPFFPSDIITKLAQALQSERSDSQRKQLEAKVAWCQTGQQAQPLFSLWSFELMLDLQQAISDGIYGPKLFFEHFPNTKVMLPAAKDGMFFNINTTDDLKLAEGFVPQDTEF